MIKDTVMSLTNAFFKIQKDYPQFTDQMRADFIKGDVHWKVDVVRMHNKRRHILETIQLYHIKDDEQAKKIAARVGIIFNQKNFAF